MGFSFEKSQCLYSAYIQCCIPKRLQLIITASPLSYGVFATLIFFIYFSFNEFLDKIHSRGTNVTNTGTLILSGVTIAFCVVKMPP